MIKANKIYMRKIDPFIDNLDNYLEWMKDENHNKFIVSVRADYTKLELVNYIESKNKKNDALLLGIFLSADNNLIGTIKLEPIDYNNSSAWLGVMIGDSRQRRNGYGIEAITKLISYAQNSLGIKSFNLGVDLNNNPAVALYQKIGFEFNLDDPNKMSFRNKDGF
jgi:RimJ/RimL family protein N-acetyltransferase